MSLAKKILLGFAVITGLVVVGLVVLVLTLDLDALVERQRDRVVAELSETLGREVRVGPMEASLFPLGLVARDLHVAGATPEQPPLLEARSARFTLSLWDVIRTFGRELRVDGVVVTGLAVYLERDAEGRWVDAELLERLREEREAPGEPGAAERVLRGGVERVTLEEGRLVLEDRAEGARLDLSPVEIQAREITFGAAPRVDVRLGVAGTPGRLGVHVALRTLPERWPLELELAAVEVEAAQLPLGPLRPWLPELPVEVAEALLEGDLRITPRGPGHRLEGRVVASGLRAGGAPFTMAATPRLDVDLEANTAQIEALALEVGASSASSRGRVRFADTVAFEELEIEGQLDLPSLARIVPLGAEVSAQGRGTFAAVVEGPPARAALKGEVDLGAAAITAPGTFVKPKGTPLTLRFVGERRAEEVRLGSLELTAGPLAASGSGRITLKEKAARAVLDVTARSDDLPGLRQILPALPELPEGSRVTLRGRVSGSAGAPASQVVAVEALDLRAGPNHLTGSLRLTNPQEPAITFALATPMLDLDALLAPRDTATAEPEAEAPGAQRVTAKGSLRADRGAWRGARFQDLEAAVQLAGGLLTLERLDAAAYGGRVRAGGTRIDLARDAVDLALAVENLSAAEVPPELTALAKSIEGTVQATARLAFRGTEWEQIAETLSGKVDLALEQGRIQGFNLVGSAARPLVEALAFASPRGIDLSPGADTRFERLTVALDIGEQLARLRQPLELATPDGVASLTGGIGLDRQLELAGRFAFAPETIARITGGRATLDRPLPVGINVGCTAEAPCVRSVDVSGAIEALAASQAERLRQEAMKRLPEALDEPLDEARGRAEREAKRQLERLFGL